MRNPYEDLCVPEDAPAAAIAARFRALALLLHPDRGGDKALFARLSAAHDEVKTPQARARADARLRESRTAQVKTPPPASVVPADRRKAPDAPRRKAPGMSLRMPRVPTVASRRVPTPFSDITSTFARSRPQSEAPWWFLGGLLADIAWAERRR